MYFNLFVEKGMREGICYIAKRLSKSSNKCMKQMNYSKPSKYFTYFVANKIYGWAMSQYLAMDLSD